MSTIELTADNLEKVIQESKTLFIDFWAAWCGPCRAFAPVFEAASEKHPDIAFAKLDTEANGEIAAALEIQAIPTLMAFREGILVFREAGALNKSGFDQLIDAVVALDADDLRRQLAEATAGEPDHEHDHDHDHGDHEGHNH